MTDPGIYADQFMGTTEIPLSAEEYMRRYRPTDVPHVWIKNPNAKESLRVDMYGSAGLLCSVLLSAEQGCYFPTIDGLRFHVLPGAYVHAATNL
jgi:hypothetical protein